MFFPFFRREAAIGTEILLILKSQTFRNYKVFDCFFTTSISIEIKDNIGNFKIKVLQDL